MFTSIKQFFQKLFRSHELKIAYHELKKINALASWATSQTDEQLQTKTQNFKDRLAAGHSLSSIRVEAYAVIREAAFRVLKKRPYDVQVLAGIILDLGVIAEMKTGEGKTLTSIFPIYLNALTGESVVVSTVNEYLAQRDAEEMGAIFQWMGLSVGVNLATMNSHQKRDAYSKDITYSTHSELGFDYLRDNMVHLWADKVQRGLNFAIIDEADSILIDEAKTPLIIAGGEQKNVDLYTGADNFVRQLQAADYNIDEESRTVNLTNSGIDLANRFFNLHNLYEISNSELIHRIQNAMRAHLILKKDVEYIVSREQILLVDSFTGRIMEGRAFSEGLQQAIQAKERVKIEPETRVLATTTYQNFFRLFKKLAGMTGTAKTEEQEFIDIYNMRVIPIPTNLPMIRVDEEDTVFVTLQAKHNAIVEEAKRLWERGQPVLIGTGQVETSEILHLLLLNAGVPHKVLNAKQNAQEAEIISQAGQVGAVTIATNMAGRGTDIKPSKEALGLGGLFILGTEKAESRRIDNQLRGRAGRQGDVGCSKFFLSLEDTLIVRFSTHDKLKQIFSPYQNQPIKEKLLAKTFLRAQKKIEGFNYDQRKSVLSYDDVIRQQRDLIYEQRDLILKTPNLFFIIERMIISYVSTTLKMLQVMKSGFYDDQPIIDFFNKNLLNNYEYKFDTQLFSSTPTEDLIKVIANKLLSCYEDSRNYQINHYGLDYIQFSERKLILAALDNAWQEHIANMDRLKQSSHVFQYAQKNPFQVYTEQGGKFFLVMIEQIARSAIEQLFRSSGSLYNLQSHQEEYKNIELNGFKLSFGLYGSMLFDERLSQEQKTDIFNWIQEHASNLIAESKWEELEKELNNKFWYLKLPLSSVSQEREEKE